MLRNREQYDILMFCALLRKSDRELVGHRLNISIGSLDEYG
jgi:hypothetical protein